jgi:hypothetical protein
MVASVVAKIDELGKAAWIATMVLAFIIFWPVGLAILAYMIWSGRMGCWKQGDFTKWKEQRDSWKRNWTHGAYRSSGNRAFDDYKAETLKRLEEEQKEFLEFIERLRKARDKAEFDQFMADRRNRPMAAPEAGSPA